MKEHLLLEEAMAAFHRETGLTFELVKHEPPTRRGLWGDAVLRLQGLEFSAEIKQRAGLLNAGALGHQFRTLDTPRMGLLVTDYINPKQAERLRQQDIQFIDTAGNAYIHQRPLFIYLKGLRNNTNAVLETLTTGRAFKPTGLKVVFALLNDPMLLNAPYRELATRAGVALGNIGWILRELMSLGYVEAGLRNDRKAFTSKERLLRKWVEAYPITLRPKLVLGKFNTTAHDWHRQLDPTEFGGCWGGELAAWYYDKYLTPGKFIVYLDKKNLKPFLQTARLRKMDAAVNQGYEVLLLEKFWEAPPTLPNPNLAPPLLVYADLVATGDPRDLEAAERLHERNLV